MLLSVIIPAYQEERTIPEVLRRVAAIDIESLGFGKEILVCDDGSTDGTCAAVEQVAAEDSRIRLVRHSENRGKGAAIRTALAEAAGDYCLIQDADLEYEVSDYPALLEPLTRGARVVYGSRFRARRRPQGMRTANFVANRILTTTANLLYGLSITDEATCFKVFETELLRSLELECNGFEFCPEVTAKLGNRRIEIVEVPIAYRARNIAEGKKVRWTRRLRGDLGTAPPSTARWRQGLGVAEAATPADADAAPTTLLAMLWRDCRRGAALALFGCVVMGVVDFAATIFVYPADVRLVTGLRLAVLAVALLTLLWLIAAVLMAAAAVAARLVISAARPKARSWPGLFAGVPDPDPGPRQVAAWLWAIATSALLYLAASSLLTYQLAPRFKEPVLTALLLAALQLGVIAVIAAVAVVVFLLVRRLGRSVHPRLGAFNPFARVAPALALMVVVAVPIISVVLTYIHGLRDLVPWRHLLALAAFTGGVYLGVLFLRRRQTLMPGRGRQRLVAIGASLVVALAVVAIALTRVGADPETKYMAITASPTLARLVDLVRRANDFDGDGYGSLLGENDCAPFDEAIHPGARDLPDNGIDENCNGRDFSLREPARASARASSMPVPERATGATGTCCSSPSTPCATTTPASAATTKRSGRDTTPNLDQAGARARSPSTFANAPSAGTMASMPAILTSKFFHSGIALDETSSARMPPKLLDDEPPDLRGASSTAATTPAPSSPTSTSTTGAWSRASTPTTTSSAQKRNPKRITSHASHRQSAVAWIARNSRRKWFLWAPLHRSPRPLRGAPRRGQLRRQRRGPLRRRAPLHRQARRPFARRAARMPGADRTIIIVTSDHGDGFNEHGFINHGQALYRELVHVPLIFYIPDIEPPRRSTARSHPSTSCPTIADLAGIDDQRPLLRGREPGPAALLRPRRPRPRGLRRDQLAAAAARGDHQQATS